MDEKTQALRELFMDLTELETVTEQQEESPGTLTGGESVADRLDALLSQMRERYSFQTDLSNELLSEIAEGFYDEQSDEELADDLKVNAADVAQARFDMHLIRASDRESSVSWNTFREAFDSGMDANELADAFDLNLEEIERNIGVINAEREMRRVNYRFRDEFDDLLGDGDVAEQLSSESTDDGLRDATEGLEINTSF